MKIIMLGAPGAGKGTQAKMIADKYSLPHVSTGDIFRANLKEGTELGKKAKEYMDKGALVPDELTVEILLDRVAKDDCKNGYVLDGFPRTIPQAEVLDSELTKLGDAVDLAIDVEVPDENIVRRMSGRRACLKCGATTVDLNQCIGCGLCTTRCEFDAIHLSRDLPAASDMHTAEEMMKVVGPYALKRGFKILKRKVTGKSDYPTWQE